MITFPNAKINIGLKVRGKRPDGFHEIESVMYPVTLSDILEIIPAADQQTSFTTSGLPIPGNSAENLCLKAYRLLSSSFQLPPVKIHLHKIIPIGAGLGGGSSDGAFALKMLNTLFALELTLDELIAFASKLGSDCPFFIKNESVFASGKGDSFLSIKLDLSGYRIELFSPTLFVNTAEAYRLLDQFSVNSFPGPTTGLFRHVQKPVEEWRQCIFNDFEVPIYASYPELEKMKNRLYDEGAVYASMTGSGSTLFGLFRK